MKSKTCVICKQQFPLNGYYQYKYVCNKCFSDLAAGLDLGILNIIKREMAQGNTIQVVLRKHTPEHHIINVKLKQAFKGKYVTGDTIRHYITKQICGQTKYKTETFSVTSVAQKLAFSVSHIDAAYIDIRTTGEPDLSCWAELLLRVIYLFTFNIIMFFVFKFQLPDLNTCLLMIVSVVVSLAVFILTIDNAQDVGIRKWQDNRSKLRIRAIKKAKNEWLR